MSTKFRYEIEGVEVHPFGEWSIDFQRNEGQIFFRKVFHGDLTFKGADYDYIMGLNSCSVLDFEIFCKDVSIFTGEFKTRYSFKIDEDSCMMTGLPDTVDEYTCIMLNYNTSFYPSYINADLFPHVSIPVKECAGAIPPTIVDLDECDSLYDHIYNMLNNNDLMDCSYAVKSSFLYLDEFPGYAPGHYAGIYGTDNYVTGEFNYLDELFLILNYYVRLSLGGTGCDWYDWTITFQFYESILRDRFNAYWYIDSDGNFRIEHVSYFLPDFPYSNFEPGLDLTTLLRSDRKIYAYRTNKYEHVTDKLFDQEVWTWQHYFDSESGITHGADFEGVPIYYGAAVGKKSNCVTGEFKEKVIPTTNLWTDIPWAIQLIPPAADPDEIECNGYLMLVRVDIPITGWQVLCAIGALTNTVGQNVFLSTANLMLNFFQWERIFLAGHLNNGATPPQDEITDFQSEIPKRLQDEITIAYCCLEDFDPMKYITTELGDGKVQAATFNKNSITVKLLYT